MRRLLLALSILTVIPVPRTEEGVNSADLARCAPLFPVAGAFLGAVLGLANICLSRPLPDQVVAALLVALAWGLSGGMHLDGLADTADGLAARAPAPRALEVMRDPRVGAAGAAAAFLVLLTKYSVLAALGDVSRTAVVLVMPAVGRQAMVTAMPSYPYPRQAPGLASPFAGRVRPRQALAGLAVTFLLAAGVSLAFPRCATALAAGTALALAAGAAAAARLARRLGGLTGDTYGAVCELAETVFLLVAVVFL